MTSLHGLVTSVDTRIFLCDLSRHTNLSQVKRPGASKRGRAQGGSSQGGPGDGGAGKAALEDLYVLAPAEVHGSQVFKNLVKQGRDVIKSVPKTDAPADRARPAALSRTPRGPVGSALCRKMVGAAVSLSALPCAPAPLQEIPQARFGVPPVALFAPIPDVISVLHVILLPHASIEWLNLYFAEAKDNVSLQGQRGSVFDLPLRPRDMLNMSEATRGKFARDFDAFGDSYTELLDKKDRDAELKFLLEQNHVWEDLEELSDGSIDEEEMLQVSSTRAHGSQ